MASLLQNTSQTYQNTKMITITHWLITHYSHHQLKTLPFNHPNTIWLQLWQKQETTTKYLKVRHSQVPSTLSIITYFKPSKQSLPACFSLLLSISQKVRTILSLMLPSLVQNEEHSSSHLLWLRACCTSTCLFSLDLRPNGCATTQLSLYCLYI